MEADIKCLACNRATRNVDLGEVICDINNPSETILVKEDVVCPKCKQQISDEGFAVKTNDILMKFVAANVCLSIGEVPQHLQRAYSVKTEIYNEHKDSFKSKPKLVKKF